MLRVIGRVLTRKKVLDPVSTQDSRLARVLNTYDLTFLGVGSTLGVGMYVLVGHVAKDIAGPAVLLSFLIAAIASAFAGLCYAEFGARAPRAGSAYIYSYVCVGEFVAFVIGWNLILEYVIGSASVARGLSLYLDTLVNDTLKRTFIEVAPMHVPFMSSYFDFLSFGVSFLLSLALAFGMKESSMVNNIFTLLNLGVVIFIIIAGSIEAHTSNWAIDPADIPFNITNTTDVGTGYFFPFGIHGMIKGAATCFYGFVGFDCIATTGEEVKNPQKAIPLAIILSLLIIFFAYMGTSTVVTLMVPYFSQDVNAPIPHAFEVSGFTTGKWIVAIGAIFGLCISLFGAMFPLPRVIYAMASDGVIFRFLGYVSTKFQTPVIGTIIAGILTGLMAALFELKHLVDMMSIGTLMAYTIVAASVLLLRYAVDESGDYLNVNTVSNVGETDTYAASAPSNEQATGHDDGQLILSENLTVKFMMKQIFNCSRYQTPNKLSEKLVTVEVFLYCVCCIFIGIGALFLEKEKSLNENLPFIVLTSVFTILAVIIVISIATQPVSRTHLYFKVPLVPFIPAISILVNIYLMLMLDMHTWIRFAVWMAVGLPTYYFSVSTALPTARNESFVSISSKNQLPLKGKTNGFMNGGYMENEAITRHEKENVNTAETQAHNKENNFFLLENGVNGESGNIMESADRVLNQLDAILDYESFNIDDDSVNNSGDSKCFDIVSCQSIRLVDKNLDSSRCDENANVSDQLLCKREHIVADVHQCNVSVSVSPVSDLSNPFAEPVKILQNNGQIEPLESEINPSTDKISKDVLTNVKRETDDLIIGNDSHKIENSAIDEECEEKDGSQITENINTRRGDEIDETQVPPKVDVDQQKDVAPIVGNCEKENIAENTSESVDEKEFGENTLESKEMIPTPPPFPETEVFSSLSIPRPRITAADFKKSKLKCTEVSHPKIPPADYEDDQPVIESPSEELPTDNLKKGSVEFSKFLKKLDKTLQQPSPVKYKNSFTSPDKTIVKKKTEVPRDSVNEDHIDKTNARKMLATLIANQVNRMADNNHECYLIPSQDKTSSESENPSNLDFVNDGDSQIPLDNSDNNQSLFNSNKPSVNHSEHSNNPTYKKNMDEVIKTIRLRKVDGIKEKYAGDDHGGSNQDTKDNGIVR